MLRKCKIRFSFLFSLTLIEDRFSYDYRAFAYIDIQTYIKTELKQFRDMSIRFETVGFTILTVTVKITFFWYSDALYEIVKITN